MLNMNNEVEVKHLADIENFIVSRTKNTGFVGHTYSYVVRNPDTLETERVENVGRPCYGELRRYKGSLKCNAGFGSSDACTRPKDPWPGDLPRPMKDGIREALGVAFYSGSSSFGSDVAKSNAFIEFVCSKDSPFRKGFGNDVRFVKNDAGMITGFIMTDTDIDPTTLVSFLMNSRNWGGYALRWHDFVASGMSKSEALLAAMFGLTNTNVGNASSYTFTINPDIKRFIEGTPNDLSSGKTWREGDDYNRPAVQDLFTADKPGSLYQKVKALTGQGNLEPLGHIAAFKKVVAEALAA